ncbi:20636_t:CDS:2, partial [Cetraspora pellucida]
ALDAKQVPWALKFIIEFVKIMLTGNKYKEINKKSPILINSPCRNTPMVPLNCKSGSEEKNPKEKKSRLYLNDSEEGYSNERSCLGPFNERETGTKKDGKNEHKGVEDEKAR